MAIFGAPLDDPAAAHHAVAGPREILVEIDRRGLADGAWPLRVGIGLHTGDAVTGNVGSPRRKEFTAIGDTVNLASGLEQLTKEHKARLIVSDAIIAAIGKAARTATKLGAATVKGYAEPVNIWRLVLRFSHMIQPIPVRTGRRAVSSRWAANHPSDSVH
jgi:adenylate cyclase